MVQAFIFTRCPLPGRRIRTLDGPQPFIFTRYPPPGRRTQTPSGPAVPLHPLSAARKAYPDHGWSSRSFSLAIRLQEGVSGPPVVHPFIFSRYPPPGRRIRTPSGPGVHLHSLSAARKAYPDPEWSSRSSSPAVRCQEGVSRPRAVQAFILTRYPLPGRRLRTPSGPAVHLHSLSAAKKAYREGPRVVQPFIFSRYSPPGRRIGTPSGPSVHLQSLSAARKAVPDRDWSRRSSSLVYPPPGRRIRSRGTNRSS